MPFDDNLPLDTALVAHLPMILRELKNYLKRMLEREHYFVDDTHEKFGQHKEVNAEAVITPTLLPPEGTDAVTARKVNIQTDLSVEREARVLQKFITPLIEHPTATERVIVPRLQSTDIQTERLYVTENLQANRLEADRGNINNFQSVTSQSVEMRANTGFFDQVETFTIRTPHSVPLSIEANRMNVPRIATEGLAVNFIASHDQPRIQITSDVLANKISANEINTTVLKVNNEEVIVPAVTRYVVSSNPSAITLEGYLQHNWILQVTPPAYQIGDLLLIVAQATVQFDLFPSMTPSSYQCWLLVTDQNENPLGMSAQVVTALDAENRMGIFSHVATLSVVTFVVAPAGLSTIKMSVRWVTIISPTNLPSPVIPVGNARLQVLNLR